MIKVGNIQSRQLLLMTLLSIGGHRIISCFLYANQLDPGWWDPRPDQTHSMHTSFPWAVRGHPDCILGKCGAIHQTIILSIIITISSIANWLIQLYANSRLYKASLVTISLKLNNSHQRHLFTWYFRVSNSASEVNFPEKKSYVTLGRNVLSLRLHP